MVAIFACNSFKEIIKKDKANRYTEEIAS